MDTENAMEPIPAKISPSWCLRCEKTEDIVVSLRVRDFGDAPYRLCRTCFEYWRSLTDQASLDQFRRETLGKLSLEHAHPEGSA